jgi:S-adenosylmethionine decarboxylase proenzyme
VQAELEVKSQQELKDTYLGQHILAEFYGCNSNILNNKELIEKMMTNAAVACGATVVEKKFHMFSPYGVSGVVIISESHLAIHTWPEYGYAAVDLFTCGDTCKPEIAYNYLEKELRADSSSYSELKRGRLNNQTMEMMTTPFEIKNQK